MEYYSVKPVKQDDLWAPLREFLDGALDPLLNTSANSVPLQFLYKYFGPAGVANDFSKIISRNDGFFEWDGIRIAAESVTKAVLIDKVMEYLGPYALRLLIGTAAAPIALEVAVAGAIASGVATIFSSLSDDYGDYLYDLFGAASTQVELFDSVGRAVAGVTYRNGFASEGKTEVDAVLSLLNWPGAAGKFAVNAHIAINVLGGERTGYDVLAGDHVAQIAAVLGVTAASIADRDGKTSDGSVAKNSTLLVPVASGAEFQIMQTGSKIGLHMFDKLTGADLFFSKNEMAVGGDLTGLKIDTGVVAVFGTGASDNIDLGGAVAKVYAYGGLGSDNIRGGRGGDVLWGDTPGAPTDGEIDVIRGGAGNDEIFGGGGGDQLFGDEGDDYINGGDGDDTINGGGDRDDIYGGVGDDTIHGGDEADIIRGGSDNIGESDAQHTNTLYGDGGNDEIYGAEGNDKLYGGADADKLFGAAGNDKLFGGAGKDRMTGGADGDEFYVGAGDVVMDSDAADKLFIGEDDASEVESAYTQVGAVKEMRNWLVEWADLDGKFLQGYNHFYRGQLDGKDRLLINTGRSLVVLWGSEQNPDFVVVKDYQKGDFGLDIFDPSKYAAEAKKHYDEYKIKSVDSHFVLTPYLEHLKLALKFEADANKPNDAGRASLLQFLDAADPIEIVGSTDVDFLVGTEAAEIFDGGAELDILMGGAGSDAYRYSAGDGDDYIMDFDGGVDDVDVLQFNDLNLTDVDISAGGTDLYIDVLGPQKARISILDQFSAGTNDGLEGIRFADGTVLSREQILEALRAVRGTSGDDELNVKGQQINDVFQTAVFFGGLGNDHIYGSDGRDTYVYAQGDGYDTIRDWSDNVGTLRLTDLMPDDISLVRFLDNTIIITIGPTGERVRIEAYEDGIGFDEIRFQDGTTWDSDDILAAAKLPPTGADLAGGTVAENSPAGTVVGTITGIDPDPNAVLSYALWLDAGGRFVIDATTGQITVAEGAVLDFESLSSLLIAVRVTNAAGLMFETAFFLNVADVNEAPTALTLVGNSVVENVADGSVVGVVGAVDPDAGDALIYALKNDVGGRFAINAQTGQITVADGALIDFEVATSHEVTVLVTDRGGLTFEKTFAISVTDANETGNNAPTNAILTGGSVAENASNGTAVGMVAGVDPDAGATLTYSLTDNAGGRFAVNATTGALTVANGALLNFESTASHNVTVRVTDQSGLTFDKVFALVVTNVNEAPSNATLTGGSVVENAANGTVVGTVAGVDPDAGATLTYTLTDDAGGRFAINASTGIITVANGVLLDYETATSHAITVHVVDQGGLAFDKTLTIALTEGEGGESYTFARGDGQVNIQGDFNSISFDPSIAASDILLQSDGSDLVILVRGTEDSIRISGDLTINDWGTSSAIQQLKFSDGSTMDIGQPAPGVGSPITFTWVGTDTSVYNGSIYGDDVFEMVSGSGWGFDTGGQTTVLYSGGQSYIWANGGTGVIKFAPGISADDVILQSVGSDLMILIRGTEDRIQIYGGLTLNDWGASSAIQQFQFSDGTTIDIGQPAPGVGSPITFTWLEAGNGSAYGNNVFEIAPGANLTFNSANSGQNTVVFGGGQNGINANGATGVIQFGAGISASDIILQSEGSDLVILVRSTDDRIQIYGGGLTINDWGVSSAIQQLRFSDGSTMDIGQPAPGVGSPITFTWVGTDTSVYNGSIYGNDIFEIVSGSGWGFDAAGGQTTALFNGGQSYIWANGGTGVVKFGPSISASDVILQSEGADLVILVRGTDDRLQIYGGLAANDWGTSSAISQLQFSDGSTMDIGQPAPGVGSPITFTWVGTDTSVYNGSIYGNDVFEMVSGSGWGFDTGGQTTVLYSGGQSYIWANGGTGVIKFGPSISPSDVILQSEGSDLIILIRGTEDRIQIYGGLTAHDWGTSSAIQQFQFSDGSTIDIGQPAAGIGSPITFTWLEPGSGSIYGNNVFELPPGTNLTFNNENDGQNTVVFGGGQNNIDPNGATGIIQFGAGISAGDIILQSEGSDLIILVRGTEDSIRISGDLTINEWGTSSAIQQLKFSDGSTMNIGQPTPGLGSPITFTWVGTSTSVYNGSIYGDDVFEMVSGSGWGFDTVGQTTVLYSGGQSYIWANGGTGVIKFAPGISADDIILQTAGSNLIILIRDTDDQILVYEGLTAHEGGTSSAIQQLQFSDGSTMDIGEFEPGVESLTVTENSADTDVAGVTLDGTAESETLTGTSEEDIFSGLGGNDTLRGLGGGDAYKFGVDSGNDLILEAGTDSGIDVVHLSALAVSDVTFSRSGSDLFIKINSSNEELIVEGQFDGHPRIEEVHFADGTVWEGSQITDAAAWIHGTTGNDTISGTGWNDTISGGAGNDTLSGGGGDDLFVFRAGFGQDSISDFSVGHDKLEFGDGVFADAAAAFAAASAQGSNTIITIDASTTVLLQNVALANLHVDDFRVV